MKCDRWNEVRLYGYNGREGHRTVPRTRRSSCRPSRVFRALPTIACASTAAAWQFEHSMNVTMDKFGRILIPKAIRQRLGLKAGTELWLDTKDHEVVLRPVSNESVLAEKDGLLVCTADLDTGSEDFDLIEHIRAVRGARTRALTS